MFTTFTLADIIMINYSIISNVILLLLLLIIILLLRYVYGSSQRYKVVTL